MRPQGLVWAAIASFVLASCGSSPPSRFYTLSSVPPAARPPSQEAPSSSLVLGKLTIPSVLDRPEIAMRVTATRLEFSELRRWAAPLDKLVRQTLAEDLSARMGHPASMANSSSGAAANAVLIVDIDEFDADPTGEVTLHARWAVTLQPRNAVPMSAEQTNIQLQPKVGDVDDVAATMSQALAMLADKIIARLRPPASPP